MKGGFLQVIIVLGIVLLIVGNVISYGINISYADDLLLVGKDVGLEIILDSTRLFDLTNLNPGDVYEANLTIENNYIAPFELFMKAERVSEVPEDGNADLFKQLLLTLYMGDKKIYSGSMEDFSTSDISLGNFNINEKRKLRAIVNLPGSETDNKFQGRGFEVKWIFIAQTNGLQPDSPESDDPKKPTNPKTPKIPILPGTGDVTPLLLYGIGAGLLGLGAVVGRKKRE